MAVFEHNTNEQLLYHKPVLVHEVLHYLDPQPGKTYLDVTFGTGGHTRAILQKEPACKVVAMDWDAVALDTYAPRLQAEFGDRLQVLWGNFALLFKILKKAGIKKVDGILADFGTSQIQIMQRPGFSFYRDTPLDMRMSPPHQTVTAAHVINKSSEQKLREIFFEFGEEKYAKKIAQAIIEQRKRKPIKTTLELAQLVERVVPQKKIRTIHPATRVFQALRIFVNKELQNIAALLSTSLTILNPQAKLVCISFHSLEDRIVKNFFLDQARLGRLRIITKKVVGATQDEILENPSARSAKLRVAEFIK